jgi:hypothetical protein
MITTSNQYKQYISRKAGSFHYVAEIKVNLESGDSLSFTEKDIAYNGISISDSTSSSGNFDIGAAIMKSCQIVLKDINGTLTQYDFNRATLNLKIGIESNDKTFTEWIPKGNFVVDSSEEGNGNVTLSCYDFLYYLDKSYSTSKLEYPATLRQIVEDCCLNCGLILSTAEFANSDFMVYTRPDD